MFETLTSRRYLVPFKAGRLPQRTCDVLVIGGGVAGLRAAIAAADQPGENREVLLLAKDTVEESNTWYAQGGIAAAISPHDSVKAHVDDTLAVGAGLCDQRAVEVVVEEGVRRVVELLEWGANFDRKIDDPDKLALGLEAGHSFARILHAYGDATGQELSNTLVRTVRSHENIGVVEKAFAVDLLTSDERRHCLGAIAYVDGRLTVIWARQTILATGGAGMLFRETTNPKVATADGHAMAWRAGATMRDMEMVQFHPTTLYVAGSARSLITEAVRGEGGKLVDRQGRRFMESIHPDGDLAPRDVVSRGIIDQIRKTNSTNVYLDVRHLASAGFAERFPSLMKLLARFEIDPAQDLIPVHPSAHYMIGGVSVDEHGQSDLPGLFAVGECSCSGLHGANRLASNSLLEGLAFGYRAGKRASELAGEMGDVVYPQRLRHDVPESGRTELDIGDVRSSLRSVMWRNTGIERDGELLTSCREIIDFWSRYVMDKSFDPASSNGQAKDGWELQNMLTTSLLVTSAARYRTESRGVHYRTDYPDRDDQHWRMRLRWHRPMLTPTPEPVKGSAEA